MTSFLKILGVSLLLLTFTSCHYVWRLRGPCSIWPMPLPAGSTPVKLDFSSSEGRFRIGLPESIGKPNAQGNGKNFRWLILNQADFHVFYVDRESAVETEEVSEALLEGFRKVVLAQGKLTAATERNLSGHPGREFKVESSGGLRVTRIFLVGNRIYWVVVFIPRDWNCKTDSAMKVLDTFEITEEDAGP